MSAKAKDQIPYELLKAASARFGLGQLRSAEPVSGGLLHRLYRCTTEFGDFAIKEMVSQAKEPNFKNHIETSSAIERLAPSVGILTPEVIFLPHSSEVLAPLTLHTSDLHFVRVHRWMEGCTPASEGKLTNFGDLVETIGRIHRMGVKPPDQYRTATYNPIQWSQWLDVHSTARPAWSDLLFRRLGTIQQFENLISNWQRMNRKRPTVPSHRDLTAKNVLLKDSRLILVDWDNANWIADPLQDVFTVAIDWSLARQGKLSEERIVSAVSAYLERTGYSPVFDTYQVYCSDWASGILAWLAFNLDRTSHADLRQRQLGEAECGHILALLSEVGKWVFGRAHQISFNQSSAATRNGS